MIAGIVVAVVVLIIGAVAAFSYKDVIIAKLIRAGATNKYASSTPNKPTVQITDGEEVVRLDTANEDAQSARGPEIPQNPGQKSQTSRSLPQTIQTLQILKVEIDP